MGDLDNPFSFISLSPSRSRIVFPGGMTMFDVAMLEIADLPRSSNLPSIPPSMLMYVAKRI